MITLRPYRPEDAAVILSWIRDERSFRQWSADRYDSYPLSPEEMNAHYAAMTASGRFFPCTAEDENGIAGHLILRYTDEDERTVRFGFVIVDGGRRGRGLGKAMLGLAVRLAREEKKAEKITLGVFENNEPARRCYRSAGFREVPEKAGEIYRVLGEEWPCVEMEYAGL